MISLQFLNSQRNIAFSYRVPNKRKILTYWSESSGSQDSQGGREYDVPGQVEKNGSGEEKARRQLIASWNYLIGEFRKDGGKLLSMVHRASGREVRTQTGTWGILIRPKDIFIYHEGGQTLEEFAQRGGRISLHALAQDLTGQVGLDLFQAGGYIT